MSSDRRISYRDGSRKLFVPDLNRLSRVKGLGSGQ